MKLFDSIKNTFSNNKHDIKFYGGIACIVLGTGAAIWGAFKAKDAIEDLQDELEDIKEEAPEEEINKEVTKAYAKTIGKCVVYALPAIALEGMGIKMCNDVHRDLKADIGTFTAALTANMKDFRNYRKKVVDKEGKEADLEYMYGVAQREVAEIIEDDEGEMEVIKNASFIDEKTNTSIFSRFFDSYCKGWTKDPEVNMAFLMRLQSDFTDKLRHDGFVVFNDVLEALGYERTALGCKAGWVLGQGDNYVDFGIHDVYRNGKFDEAKTRFLNGYERTVLLDFNITCADITPFINEGRRKAAKYEF